MADILLGDLEAALVAEGVKIEQKVLHRVFRKLAHPSGCEHCGSNTKVATATDTAIVTNCCGTKVADIAPEPTPKPEAPADPPKEN